MDSGAGTEGGRIAELKKAYLQACCEHNMQVAHRLIGQLQELTGTYCSWARHTDGGHNA